MEVGGAPAGGGWGGWGGGRLAVTGFKDQAQQESELRCQERMRKRA